METIEVGYKPIPGLPGLLHKYIIYTDSNGDKHFARGGYESGIIPKIDTLSGDYVDPGENPELNPDWDPDFDDDMVPIAEDDDLSQEWEDILGALEEIENGNSEYLPFNNSNSVVDTALQRAGLPATDDPNDRWAPGSGQMIPLGGHTPPFWDGTPRFPYGNVDPHLNPVPKSPLVLDTNFSHSIDLTTLGDTGTYFDLNGDGQAELTAWITDGDGLLARDLNANGNIDDITELFGSESEDGFTALRDLDSNSDGKITGADDDWGDLVVWIDENMDALTQDGELHTLDGLGIVSISLDATLQEDMAINGSQITHTSTFITDADEAFGIVDAWFDHNVGMTRNNEYFTFDERAEYLPTLSGSGQMKDLYIAASIDNGATDSVMSLLTDITTTILDYTGPAEAFESWSDIETDVDALLLKWAGVEDVTSGSRGDHVDAQHLAFYEAFTGQAFEQYGQPNPLIEAGAQIEAMYAYIKTYLTAQIVGQVIGADLFEVAPTYSLFTGAMDGDMALSQDAMDDFAAAAEVAADPVEVWTHFAQFLGYTKGFANLTGAEITMLDGAVDDTNEASLTDWADVVNTMTANLGSIIDSPDDWGSFEVYYDAIINGTSGADTLTAASNVSHLITGQGGNDTITGLAGHDRLEGGSGNDTLDGGAGDDFLLGSSGDDTYIWSSGNDTFSDSSSSTDEIQVAASTGLVSTDVVDIYRSGGNLTIQMPGGAFLTIDSQFVSSSNRIETLRFMDDNSTISLTNLPNLNTYGTAASETLTVSSLATGNVLYGNGGNDKLVGGSGADELHGGAGADFLSGHGGNDVLDGGSGDDEMSGESYGDANGNTTYMASAGHDQIRDRGGDDQIVFADGLTAEDLNLTRVFDPNEGTNSVGDLKIEWGANAIRVKYQFDDAKAVETLLFDDTSTLDIAETQITTYGSDDAFLVNADYDTFLEEISGIETAGYNHDDIIYAQGGDDTVHGLDGEDLIYGGDGNDTLEGGGGSDTLDGGAGDDVLYGDEIEGSAQDSDIYYASTGNDTIYGGWDGDVLIMPETVALSDVSISRSGYDLVVSWDGNTTTIIDQSVDEIQFPADGFTLDATQFADFWFFGTSGADTLNGTSSADTIYGLAGDDTINGSSGADILIGGAGNDTLNGGNDEDTADYFSAAAAVTVNLSTGSASNDGDGSSDTLSSIEDVIGSGYADTITGDVNANYIAGLSGNDTISAGDGDDTLLGGAGNDTISAGDGDDTLLGGAGNDTLDGGNGVDFVAYYNTSGSGVTVNLGTGTATGEGTDTLSNIEGVIGSIYADTLTGDGSDNGLSGYGGADSISGGDGNDTLLGGFGNDTLDGGNDVDTVSYLDSLAGVNVNLASGTASDGFSGTDTISNVENVLGSNYNDTITGSSGTNVIEGGEGNDTLDGGSGTDTVSYSGATLAVTVSLANGSAQNTVGAGTDTLSGFENLSGSAYNDNLTGDTPTNVITGGMGNDTLAGAAGDDIYVYNAGDGDDVITDSAGADIIKLGSGLTDDDVDFIKDGDDLIIMMDTDSITVNDHFASGNDYAVETLLFDDTSTIDLTDITLTIHGTSGADTLTGTANADTIYGYAGNDTISGLADADTIDGGDDNDTLTGGAGNDTLNGGEGTDTVYYSAAASGVTVNLGSGTASNDGDGGADTISDVENVIGSAYADTITGNSGNNTIVGGAGNDTINGNAGTDTVDYSGAGSAVTVNLSTGTATGDGTDTLSNLENVIGSTYNDTVTGNSGNNTIVGGAGNDTINGNAGTDTVDYSGAGSAVTVNLSTGTATGDGTDTLSNLENVIGSTYNDTITGNTNANVLTGGAGNDTISGGQGYDVLYGDDGNDYLYGDAGNDTLIGDSGDDTLDGGADYDVADYRTSTSAVTASLVTNTASDGFGYTDAFVNIEALTGSDYNDFLTGNTSANNLRGEAGVDTIYAGGGADALFGGSGDDILYAEAGDDGIHGDAGDDYIDGGTGDDYVYYINAPSGVTLDLSSNEASDDGYGDTDQIYNIENVWDSAYSDSITGNNNSNRFLVGAGDDTIYGGGGNDIIQVSGSGAGDDYYDGGSGSNDMLAYSGSSVTVDLSNHTATDSNGDTDTIYNIETISGTNSNDSIAGDDVNNDLRGNSGNDFIDGRGGGDTLTGGNGNDEIHGGDGNDTLQGGNNDDILYGEDGYDILTGGSGIDTFVFEAATAFNDADNISDFSSATDYIDISDVLDGFFNSGTDDINDFVTLTEVSGDTKLYVDRDGTAGTYSAQQIMLIDNVTGLDVDILYNSGSGHLIAT